MTLYLSVDRTMLAFDTYNKDQLNVLIHRNFILNPPSLEARHYITEIFVPKVKLNLFIAYS